MFPNFSLYSVYHIFLKKSRGNIIKSQDFRNKISINKFPLYATISIRGIFLEITDFSDKKAFAEFDEFARKFGEFTQSPRWVSVKRRWRGAGVVVRNPDGAVTAECLVLIRKTPFGSLMYAPRGFIGEYSSEVWAEMLSGIEELSRKYHAVDDIKPVQPKENVILRIAKPFSEIERGFKSDYRNRIRKAVKRGVRFEVHGEEALDEFYELYAETGRRGKFPVRSKEYFSEILRAFGCECKIFLCRIQTEKRCRARSELLSERGLHTFTAGVPRRRETFTRII